MCTSMQIRAIEGDVFWGRTMDFADTFFHQNDPKGGINFPGKITSFPRGVKVPSQTPDWTTQYAASGVGVAGTAGLFDGVNEHGLAGDMQVLVEATTASPESLSQRGLKGVFATEYVAYILTTCKTVADVRAAAAKTGILADDAAKGIPLHYAFVDETGAGVVLEPTDHGAFKVYDNIGAMTNSPEYGYHTTNLRNYVSLDAINRGQGTKLGDYQVQPIEFGTGYGMFGLPGDYTSPSRFVRAMVVSHNLPPFHRADGIQQLYNCFKTVMVPEGLGRDADNENRTDSTQYWAGFDLAKRTMTVQDSHYMTPTVKTVDPDITEITYQDLNKDYVAHVL
ncbi:linear amide C-N hydrolase [Schleiferilactobacillus harbinensis]|uniref:Linear amide C-N hydrolase n=2 Tax=Schleiferilactobacillus harbinensis TaxID=304207 RepID=A0A5P8Q0P0_9LACO|nr:linear amide C-N hydrolase [Schleiferilactobacillus harbinensis]MCI1686983.1 linear amide C-N hydrolase [Schleiferilactobacillus harbinensis]MCI1784326.1 linear amide C-N hydrolase [Schleiferilactobacillus harbinensis]MCI1850944.1 linear amide C-N hydrolase [Schleiferilactobacillus harbinensis]QFR24724.1 linear amide C-N hydrolase [Schleiferilactobacillus harbinensis]QFR63146.1 linear amide C-N hydrolase [Schleiferilactobacillus harbinensis]